MVELNMKIVNTVITTVEEGDDLRAHIRTVYGEVYQAAKAYKKIPILMN